MLRSYAKKFLFLYSIQGHALHKPDGLLMGDAIPTSGSIRMPQKSRLCLY